MDQHFDRLRPVAAYPYHVYLGPSHVVEVKKGAQQIGIYLITATHRRRGVVLPIDIWYILQNSIDLVNLAIDFSKGLIVESNYDCSTSNQYGHGWWDGQYPGGNATTGLTPKFEEPYRDSSASLNTRFGDVGATFQPTNTSQTLETDGGCVGWPNDGHSFSPKEEAIGFYEFFTTNHPDGEGR